MSKWINVNDQREFTGLKVTHWMLLLEPLEEVS